MARRQRTSLAFLSVLGLVFLVGLWPLVRVVDTALEGGAAALWATWGDPLTLEVLRNTLVVSFATAAAAVLVGTPLAWLVARTDLPFRRQLRGWLTLPYVIPPYVAAVAWIHLAAPRVGFLNRALHGVASLDVYGLGGLVWVLTLSLFPYVFLTVSSALANADPALEDAARTSGAGTWRVLKDVSLPIMRPAILSGGVLVFLAAASAFGAPALLASPARVEVLSTRIFEAVASGLGGMGEASRLACLLLAFVLVPALLRARRHAIVTGKATPPTRLPLGRARRFVLALVLLFVAIGILLPVLAVVAGAFLRVAGDLSLDNWTFDNVRLLARSDAGPALWTSLGLAFGAAGLACALGLAVAWIQVRTRRRGRTLLAGLHALPLATPGTVLALGLVLVWTDFLGLGLSLTNTVWILLVAYVARFGALAARPIAEGFGAVDDALPDAARLSGARGPFLFRTIWLPLLLPALAAGFFLVFMPAFSELTMSVLLVGPGLETVGTKLFELQEYEGPTAASVLATVVLVLVVSTQALLAFLQRGRRE